MLSNHELRQRADFVREQLGQTMKVSENAIRASAEIIEDVRKSREIIKGYVETSAKHLHNSRVVLGRRNPK